MYLISDSNITDSDTDNIRFFSDTVADFSDGFGFFGFF